MVSMISVMSTTLIASSTPEIVEEFNKNDFARSLILVLSSLPAVFIAPSLGFLADRLGRRKIMSVSLLIFGLGGIVGYLANSFELFLFSRVLIGCGSSGLIGLVITSIADFWEGKDRIKYIGYNSAVISTGLMILPLIGGYLAESFGWRVAVIPMSIGVIASVVIWKFLPEVKRKSSGNFSEQLVAARLLIRDSRFQLSLVMLFLIFFMIFGALLTVLPDFLKDKYQMSESQRSTVYAVAAFSTTVAGIYLSKIRKKLGARKLILFCTVLFSLGNLVVGFSTSLSMVYMGAVIFGFAEGASVATLQELVVSSATQHVRATAMLCGVAIIRLAQASGALIFGLLLSVFENNQLLVLAGLTYLVAFLVQLVFRKQLIRV